MYTAIEDTTLKVRYVRFRGRKARLIGYMPKTETRGARFIIIDSQDLERSVARESITFIKKGSKK